MADIAEAVLERSGYVAGLEASTDLQDASRVENLKELVAVAREFDALRGRRAPRRRRETGWERTRSRRRRPGSLADFLEQVSQVSDADHVPAGEDHAARCYAR